MLNHSGRLKNAGVCSLLAIVCMASPLGVGPARALDIGSLVKGVMQQHGGGGSSLEGMIRSIAEASTGAPLSEVDGESDVVLYSRPSCGYCKQAKQYLVSQRIPHVERNIETSDRHKVAYEQAGGNGVPHFVIGQQTMRGWSANRFRSLYEAEGLPRRRDLPPSDNAPSEGTNRLASSKGWSSGDILLVKLAKVPLLAEPTGGAGRRSTLAKNEEVIYTGEERGGYSKVTTAEAEGWVSTPLLAKR